MKYYCRICTKFFKTRKEFKENVYIVYGMERYDNSENVKYKNSAYPFHLSCIDQFKKDNEYQIPDTELFNYKMVVT